MDIIVTAPCCNCCQPFNIVDFQPIVKGRLPYTLKCGHSVCDKCLYTLINSGQPIKCTSCQGLTDLSQHERKFVKENYNALRQFFPINIYIVGQLTCNHISMSHCRQPPPPKNYTVVPAGLSVVNFPVQRQRQNHHNFNFFRNGQDIDKFVSTLTICKEHCGKTLEFFCQTCEKCICSSCLVKTCSGHTFVLAQEMDTDFLDKIAEGRNTVRDTLLRIENTIKILEKKRFTMMYGSVNAKSMETEIANLFARIHAKLAMTERSLVEEVLASKNTYESFMQSLRDSAETMMNLIAAADYVTQNSAQSNLPAMVTALQMASETPWYLEDDDIKISPNMELDVDAEVEESIMKFCKLKVDSPKLKLLASSQLPSYMELPPPPEPEEVLDTMSQKSGASGCSARTMRGGFDFSEMDFALRPKKASAPSKATGQHVNLVRPLPTAKQEEKTIRPLAAGMEEKVNVTHIVNPHCFFVQRCITRRKLFALSDSYNQIKETLVAPEEDTIKPGVTFITFHSSLKWTRVTIINEKVEGADNMCYVKFMDYGHSGNISKQRLRVMTEPFVPPFALECALAECEPVNEKWTEEDSKLVHKILGRNKENCLISIMDIKDDVLQVDLISNPFQKDETPSSVRDALIFLGHATLTKGNNKIHRHGKGADFHRHTFQFFYKQKLSAIEDVIVATIISPNKFYVRKDSVRNYYSDLQEQLNGYYSLENENGVIYSPAEGMCVACYVENTWCRGRIVALKPDCKVSVFLVDVGTVHIIPWNFVRRLIMKFLKSEELVSECTLAQIKSTTEHGWQEDAITFMTNCLGIGARCRLKLSQPPKKRKGNIVNCVLLYKTEEDSFVCLNSLFVKNGFATAQGFIPSMNGSGIEEKELPQTILKREMKTGSLSLSTIQPEGGGPVKLEVGVLSATSPTEIYISLKSKESEDDLKNLYAEMQKAYKTSKPDNSCEWKPGDKCSAFCKKENQWSRATIEVSDAEKKEAKVFFRDFGFAEVVSYQDMRPLSPRFLSVRDGALKCHLSGITPASGDKWPMLTCESLQDMIDEYDKFYITKDGEISNMSLPVELWVFHVTPGGALTPTIKEFRKINDMIIEKGLAIPSRVLKSKNEASKEVVAEKKDQPPIDPLDWNVMNPPVTVERWLPPVPFKHKEFTAMGTYVEENLDIFLYDIEENSSELDLLSNFLTNYFKESKPKPYDLFWFDSQICITKYELDNKYYRAQVLKVNENNTAFVRFVDYGNTQTCPISSLRKDIVLENIPIQNYRCRLHGIKPKDGDKWSEGIGDLVHKSVVDKNSLVTVVGEPDADGVIPIRLKVNMSHDLADLLVSLHYAVADVAPIANQPLPQPPQLNDDDPDIIVEEEIPHCEEIPSPQVVNE